MDIQKRLQRFKSDSESPRKPNEWIDIAILWWW